MRWICRAAGTRPANRPDGGGAGGMMASLPLKPERFLTARGCLDLLWTTWENCPLTPLIRTLLNSTSSRLPAIPRVGLELRLGTGEMRVDMHQLVTKSGGESSSPALGSRQTAGSVKGCALSWPPGAKREANSLRFSSGSSLNTIWRKKARHCAFLACSSMCTAGRRIARSDSRARR